MLVGIDRRAAGLVAVADPGVNTPIAKSASLRPTALSTLAAVYTRARGAEHRAVPADRPAAAPPVRPMRPTRASRAAAAERRRQFPFSPIPVRGGTMELGRSERTIMRPPAPRELSEARGLRQPIAKSAAGGRLVVPPPSLCFCIKTEGLALSANRLPQHRWFLPQGRMRAAGGLRGPATGLEATPYPARRDMKA